VNELREEVRILRQEVSALQEGGQDEAGDAKQIRAARAMGGRRLNGAAKLSEPVEDGVEVSLEGDAVRVIVNDVPASARYLLPSRVPPSEYGLWAAFADGKVRYIEKFTIGPEPVTVTCLGSEKTCTVN
jgi:hypothetical protein